MQSYTTSCRKNVSENKKQSAYKYTYIITNTNTSRDVFASGAYTYINIFVYIKIDIGITRVYQKNFMLADRLVAVGCWWCSDRVVVVVVVVFVVQLLYDRVVSFLGHRSSSKLRLHDPHSERTTTTRFLTPDPSRANTETINLLTVRLHGRS